MGFGLVGGAVSPIAESPFGVVCYSHWIQRAAKRLEKLDLPKFRYHPDPVETGNIKESDNLCASCGNARGYIYTGPVFSIDELDDCICPWCIADGNAHEKFDASFTDRDEIGDYGSWEDVPESVRDEIAHRTPGFCGWQQERWWTHCNDAAAFLGPAGGDEVTRYGQDLIESLQKTSDLKGDDWEEFRRDLSSNGSPTAYVFKCLHCGKLGGYQDCH
jgi:uncharacterized protein CbrC (UPF0167 family)